MQFLQYTPNISKNWIYIYIYMYIYFIYVYFIYILFMYMYMYIYRIYNFLQDFCCYGNLICKTIQYSIHSFINDLVNSCLVVNT